MNLRFYMEQKLKRSESEPVYRHLCAVCLQPEFGCYCGDIEKLNPGLTFVILIHPIEFRRRIATGRMAHLCLEGSHLIVGQDYSRNDQVNALLEDPEHHPVVLYPGTGSTDMTELTIEAKRCLFPRDKKLLLFVIDGTWATARKMMWQSRNLHGLPRVCFQPSAPSRFRVRKQPSPECYSTIEAVHQALELIGPVCGFDVQTREHDKLIRVFDRMVERQIRCTLESHARRGGPNYRRQNLNGLG